MHLIASENVAYFFKETCDKSNICIMLIVLNFIKVFFLGLVPFLKNKKCCVAFSVCHFVVLM